MTQVKTAGTILAMGEMMARLMPPGHLTMEQASSFDIYFGGDEAIVASSLARFGLEAGYISKLPDNVLGDRAAAALRGNGVATGAVVRGGERLGINFYENGASVRPSKVLYDRKHSAMSEAEIGDFDFDEIFSKARWFHVSGITPALSPRTAELTKHAMRRAKANGVGISYDFNYRKKLWSPQDAKRTALELLPFVDVLLGIGIGDGLDPDLMLGFAPQVPARGSLDGNLEALGRFFENLYGEFGFAFVSSTMRRSQSASDNGWSAAAYQGEAGRFYKAREYALHLVDRGGGGAAYSAGFLYGTLTGMTLEQTTEFATAAGALKQTIPGDFNLSSLEDVRLLASGDGSGRVQR